MKQHTTNYFDSFIEVAEDTKACFGNIPPIKEKRTVAQIQYELITKNPYKLSSDDILFQVFAEKNDLIKSEYKAAREQFFSKGQPCLRTSPLTKNCGYGVHFNSEGMVAIYGMETEEYQKFLADSKTKKIKAMKSSR